MWTDDPTDDYLQSYGNKRRNVWLMKWMFAVGRLVPWLSMGLIVVGRRR